ncbi:MAG: minor capsid protein [Clostridia bacterium]|nr:minor capsid protein [Clostridia bacterium]
MSLDYWERRQVVEDAQIAFENAEETIRRIEKLHAGVERRIRAMQTRIRQRFKSAYNLSEEKAKELLSSPVGREEYLKLLEEIGRLGKDNPMREELLAKAAAPAYAYRMKLEDAMELENDAITARMAEEEQRILEKHLTDTVKEQNMRAAFRIQHKAGVAFRVRGVSEELARVIINRPWSGMSFSARIWKNREALAEWLNDDLASGLVAGVSGETLARELSEKLGVSMNRARTLVRTETTHVCSAADFEAYEEAELEEYVYSAVLDVRTSKICRRLDHKHFKVKDKQVGVNCPPMHPNCRSLTVTAGISDEELARMTRWARDPVTGKGVKVPANMSYEEWRKLQAETYGEERVAAGEKMARNKAKDKKQFKRYQQILGKKQLPKDLASFQQMKYTEPEEWADVKYYAANKGERPVWCVKVDRALEKAGINKGKCYPAKPIEIQGWNQHAEKRLRQRNVTKERATAFQDQALGMFKRFPQPETQYNYFSEDGVIGIRASDGIVQTIYGKDDFKPDTLKVLEVLREYGQ